MLFFMSSLHTMSRPYRICPGLELAIFLPSLLLGDRGTRAPLAAASSRRKAAALDEQPDYSAHLPRLSSVSCTECSLSLSTRRCAPAVQQAAVVEYGECSDPRPEA